ncbi:hypothetical protein R3I94_017741 [Phoxinus phoxinus]
MDTHTETETQALVEMRELIRSLERVGPRDPNSNGNLDPLNSLRPFSTAQKPTCGFSFSQDTDHRRKHNGLQPCDPNKWRSARTPQ